MTQNLLSSQYVDLKEDIISKEEYQMFRENYLEQITKLNENIEYYTNPFLTCDLQCKRLLY